MEAVDLSADLTYEDLARIVDENGEPFASLSQCELFLRAANMLRRRVPEEQDHAGERMKTRDLNDMMQQARKARSVFLLSSGRAQVIVPTDDLR